MGLKCLYSSFEGEYNLYLIIWVWNAYTVYLRSNYTCAVTYGSGVLIQFI